MQIQNHTKSRQMMMRFRHPQTASKDACWALTQQFFLQRTLKILHVKNCYWITLQNLKLHFFNNFHNGVHYFYRQRTKQEFKNSHHRFLNQLVFLWPAFRVAKKFQNSWLVQWIMSSYHVQLNRLKALYVRKQHLNGNQETVSIVQIYCVRYW